MSFISSGCHWTAIIFPFSIASIVPSSDFAEIINWFATSFIDCLWYELTLIFSLYTEFKKVPSLTYILCNLSFKSWFSIFWFKLPPKYTFIDWSPPQIPKIGLLALENNLIASLSNLNSSIS